MDSLKSSTPSIVIGLLCLILFCFLLPFALVYFKLTAVIWVSGAYIAFIFCFSLLFFEKRISTAAIAAFVIGVFLLASSITTFATENFAIDTWGARALSNITLGIICIGAGLASLITTPFRQLFFDKKPETDGFVSDEQKSANKKKQDQALMRFIFAILYVAMGFYRIFLR